MKATIPNRLSFSFWLSYLKGLVYGLCSWRFFVSLTAPRRSMWKASGRWVARKSFCIVCCCFGTQTGLRKKSSQIPLTTTETCSFYPGQKIKGDATTNRNRPERFNEVYTWLPLWIELMGLLLLWNGIQMWLILGSLNCACVGYV